MKKRINGLRCGSIHDMQVNMRIFFMKQLQLFKKEQMQRDLAGSNGDTPFFHVFFSFYLFFSGKNLFITDGNIMEQRLPFRRQRHTPV